MIKFNGVPKLNGAEKQFVVETLKPLLKQNRILKVRGILGEIDNNSSVNIIDFLLYHLQDAYFEGCDEIFEWEFHNSKMVSIVIPSNITHIYNSAFWVCEKLESVSIPNGVTEIERYIFAGCKNLKNIVIPQTVVSIGTSAFIDCYSLTDVYIPDKVEWIEPGAFKDCYNLKRVSVPSSCNFDWYTFDKGVEIIRR